MKRLDSRQLQAIKRESDPPPTDENDPLVASVLGGRYRVLKRIADGAQARVYLARHRLIKRLVAIKVLEPGMALDQDLVRRFLDEGQIVGTMGHPNVVESLDMGVTDDGRPYIVLEYLQGETIASELHKRGPFGVGRVAWIARQVADALQACHDRGVVHRDLKPENVFLIVHNSRPDHVKLIDFGVSRVTNDDSERTSQRALVFGTPEYMSPEQITDPASLDGRCDIYALGAMIYEMLTGKMPFEGDSHDQLFENIVLTEPRSLSERRPGLPDGLLEIVDRCLRKDPDDRYLTMSEVEVELEAFAEEPPPVVRSSMVRGKARGSMAPPSMPPASIPPPKDGLKEESKEESSGTPDDSSPPKKAAAAEPSPETEKPASAVASVMTPASSRPMVIALAVAGVVFLAGLVMALRHPSEPAPAVEPSSEPSGMSAPSEPSATPTVSPPSAVLPHASAPPPARGSAAPPLPEPPSTRTAAPPPSTASKVSAVATPTTTPKPTPAPSATVMPSASSTAPLTPSASTTAAAPSASAAPSPSMTVTTPEPSSVAPTPSVSSAASAAPPSATSAPASSGSME